MKKYTQNPMYVYLMVLVISATAGLQVWRTLFDNFAVHIAGLNGFQVGIIQSVKEIPGFLALIVVYVLLFVKEHRLSALSILVLGFGVAATGFLPTFYGLVVSTLVMSFGFHYFETTNQSLTLQYFDEKNAPIVFGKLRALASASNIGVGILIFMIAPFLSYRNIYLIFGGLIIASGLWAIYQNPEDKNIIVQKKNMIFKKKYWLFYFLTFMAGARRQIFVAFAVFLLVRKFAFPVQWIALLFLINNLVNYFLSPVIGKCIVRFGEQKVLTLEYFSMILIFISYAFVTSRLVAAFLYIADHLFFNFAIAIRTFFQKIADPSDIAPSMAVGFTINHIAAVVLPAIGGMLWLIDYRIPFIGGAVLSFLSLILVQKIGHEIKKKAVNT